MSDGEQTETPADTDTDDATPERPESSGARIFSMYGVASTVLGSLSVVAIALSAILWSVHHDDVDERAYQSRVMRVAAEWTGVLINMNNDNVDASLQRLRQETVGQLNVDFDSAVAPYREVFQRLQSRSIGQVQAVALESVHQDLDAAPGARPPVPADPLPSEVASRTDTALVVATSVAENVGGKPQTVHWNLRLDVSDVDGTMLISRLGSIK